MYQVIRNEGITGFYKGMLMATAKQLPTGVVTYVVYEHVKKLAEKFAQLFMISFSISSGIYYMLDDIRIISMEIENCLKLCSSINK